MKKKLLYIICFVFASLVMSAQNYNKMSHSLRQKIKSAELASQSKSLVHNNPDEKNIFALIKTTDNIVEDYCISHKGNIHIVYMPVSKIAEISDDERIIRIESEPNKATVTNDSARSVTNTNISQQGGGVLPQAYDGTGVLAGN